MLLNCHTSLYDYTLSRNFIRALFQPRLFPQLSPLDVVSGAFDNTIGIFFLVFFFTGTFFKSFSTEILNLVVCCYGGRKSFVTGKKALLNKKKKKKERDERYGDIHIANNVQLSQLAKFSRLCFAPVCFPLANAAFFLP